LNEEVKRQHRQQQENDYGSDRLVLSSLHLYQDNNGFSPFRRPSWAQVEVESPQGAQNHWIYLGEATFGGSPPPAKFPHTPRNRKLCYKINGPIWPSAAKMIGRACLFGKIDGMMDLGG
jgi:hypothetical protein